MSVDYNQPVQIPRRKHYRSVRGSKAISLANGSAKPVTAITPTGSKKDASLLSPLLLSSLSDWLSTAATVSLIFGGCCSNVYALEAIVKAVPDCGTLVTCFQFLLICGLTLPSQLDLSRGWRRLYLKPRGIPFRRWLIYTALFVSINLLNNIAFGYRISIPLHIILRSAGPVATMTVHRLMGRRFSVQKVAAVVLLFIGVVQAALADANSKPRDPELSGDSAAPQSEFWAGFSILYLALVLSAIMGVLTDRMYATYGRGHTEETLFYSHTLSLPFFLIQSTTVQTQAQQLLASPRTVKFFSDQTLDKMPFLVTRGLQLIPIQVLFLLVNGFTQYLCIRGVNQLSARSSSLTVAIVLNIRKLISLLLSIWLFGNRLAPGVLLGATLVFLGGGLYAIPDSNQSARRTKRDVKKDL